MMTCFALYRMFTNLIQGETKTLVKLPVPINKIRSLFSVINYSLHPHLLHGAPAYSGSTRFQFRPGDRLSSEIFRGFLQPIKSNDVILFPFTFFAIHNPCTFYIRRYTIFSVGKCVNE